MKIMKILKFKQFVNESKIQPTAGALAGKLIDYLYDEEIDYMYYSDFEGLEMPLSVVDNFIKRTGISGKEAVMVLDVPKSKDYKKTIKMAKKLGVCFYELLHVSGESAIIFSEKQ